MFIFLEYSVIKDHIIKNEALELSKFLSRVNDNFKGNTGIFCYSRNISL